MKKLFFLLIASVATGSTQAQAQRHNHADSLLSRVVLDINMLGGGAMQTFTTANTSANYLNALNLNTGALTYNKGYSYGGDLQIGVFFGKKRHFGLGSGILIMAQHGEASLDNYHVEYQATDGQGNIFRQVVSGHDIRETIRTQSTSIPILLKYKNRFSKHWGFTADAGAILNLQTNNEYTTHASFDYEAIYKLTKASDGGTVSVYDNSSVPAAGDWLITKAEFLKNNPNGNVTDYFNTKRALGYRVGEGISPTTSTGSSAYTSGSVGFMIQPSFNYFLSDHVALNFGAFYMYQPFKNNAQTSYRLTDGIGAYNSVTNNVTASNSQSYGVNLGARFFFQSGDRDHDGIRDKRDKCPDVWGLAKFDGCPDTDGDGIPDSQDSCVLVKGIAQFYGCPDSDGDGIPDKLDECPYAAGPIATHGCPDRDNDGILDKDDLCPDVFGLAAFHGCPDRDGDGVPDKDDKCPDVAGPISNQGCPIVAPPVEVQEKIDIATPILFETNKTTVHPSSEPVLDEAVIELKENKGAVITIDGHADITGNEAHNRVLSLERANAVKSQLVKRGVNPKRLKTRGHGSTEPAAPNDTYEGKQKNRRAVMKISGGK